MSDEQGRSFEIEGEQYEIPVFGTLTLDEAVVMFDICGVIQEQLAPLHPEAPEDDKKKHELDNLRLIADPRFKLALAAIAYKRKHPDADDVKLRLAAGSANAQDVTLAFLWGDDSPPVMSSQKPQGAKRNTSDPSSSGDSGKASGSDSEGQVVPLSATGTGR